MDIIQGCKTCKWNFGGTCADAGAYGYGGKIPNDAILETKTCWQIGLDYFDELLDMLPDDVKQMYMRNHAMSHEDLIPLVLQHKDSKKERC